MLFSAGKKSQQGFSLVELMVVVAIIGILASIAIPSVNKYMAKARQSEAKTNLSSIYTSNKAFFTEYGIYDTRFRVIGFTPEGKLRYNVGWTADAATNLATYGYTSTVAAGSNAVAYCGAVSATGAVGANGCGVMADGNQALQNSVITPASAFTAVAAGKISQGATIDRWSITQAKVLTNTADGTQ